MKNSEQLTWIQKTCQGPCILDMDPENMSRALQYGHGSRKRVKGPALWTWIQETQGPYIMDMDKETYQGPCIMDMDLDHGFKGPI